MIVIIIITKLRIFYSSSSSSSSSSSFICHFVVYILQKDKIELMEARSPQETNWLLVNIDIGILGYIVLDKRRRLRLHPLHVYLET